MSSATYRILILFKSTESSSVYINLSLLLKRRASRDLIETKINLGIFVGKCGILWISISPLSCSDLSEGACTSARGFRGTRLKVHRCAPRITQRNALFTHKQRTAHLSYTHISAARCNRWTERGGAILPG